MVVQCKSFFQLNLSLGRMHDITSTPTPLPCSTYTSSLRPLAGFYSSSSSNRCSNFSPIHHNLSRHPRLLPLPVHRFPIRPGIWWLLHTVPPTTIPAPKVTSSSNTTAATVTTLLGHALLGDPAVEKRFSRTYRISPWSISPVRFAKILNQIFGDCTNDFGNAGLVPLLMRKWKKLAVNVDWREMGRSL